MRKLSLTVLMSLGLLGCAAERVEPMNVPLVYSPSPSSPSLTGVLSCTAIGPLEVTDARADKSLGLRTLENKPLKASVSTSSDPTAWVRQGVDSYLSHNGLKVQGSGPKLALTLEQLVTTESVYHRASYTAVVGLTGELKSPGGKSCWKGTVEGKGDNYGYAGSTENYQETLNSALDSASQQMAAPQAFRDALCHCGD
jgi:hypothetical protein